MPRKTFLPSILLGLFLVTSQAFAGMYRWTDDEGDVVYSQTPPPDNRPVKPIAPPPPPAENTSQIQQQTQKLQEQLDNIARERNEKKQKQQEAAQEKKQKAEKCKVARSNLKSMQEKPPNTLWGLPDGSYQRFTVEERQKEIDKLNKIINENCKQACLRPRDRFWDIPVPKIDSAFDNLLVPQPSWSPSTTQQLRKLVAAPYLAPNDWTPRSEAYFVFPLAQGTPGKQCGLAATGVYQPSLRSPWLAA